jgi:hypothetical protein
MIAVAIGFAYLNGYVFSLTKGLGAPVVEANQQASELIEIVGGIGIISLVLAGIIGYFSRNSNDSYGVQE